MLTTFTSYGTVAINRQADIIAALRQRDEQSSMSSEAVAAITAILDRERKKA
ncbi:hypothetical protein [Rhizobium sp. SG2393]|uniref:hypothetical protein n=1 Tax=Rhizobium sp. SG2393 TaxID=3276279 RepID=UPI00366A9DEE